MRIRARRRERHAGRMTTNGVRELRWDSAESDVSAEPPVAGREDDGTGLWQSVTLPAAAALVSASAIPLLLFLAWLTDADAEFARHAGGGPVGFDRGGLAFRIAAVMCAIVSAAGAASAATRWTRKRRTGSPAASHAASGAAETRSAP